MVIAIDFDGTITKNSPYPIVGKLRPYCRYAINELIKDGHRCVLYTCRKGKYHQEAIDLLKEWDIDLIIPCDIQGKLEADIYIDDRGYKAEEIDWLEVLEWIRSKANEVQ